jgi:hypothetical protein
MCAYLGVSRSGYYNWRGAGPSQHAQDDETLIVIMKELFARACGNPGVRRMRAELAAVGYRLSGKRVHRLMKAAGPGLHSADLGALQRGEPLCAGSGQGGLGDVRGSF